MPLYMNLHTCMTRSHNFFQSSGKKHDCVFVFFFIPFNCKAIKRKTLMFLQGF